MGPGQGHALSVPAGTLVRPASATTETVYVFGVMLLLVAATVWLARVNAQPEQQMPLADWQVSAFHDLNETDQAIYNALHTAAVFLWADYMYTQRWVAVEDLLDPEYGYAPFAKDASWKQTGEVQWNLSKTFSFEGSTVYFGNNGKIPGQSAYLLILSHAHKGASYSDQSTVWIHPNPRIAAPDTIKRESLIRNGWKEVVPYSGDAEVRRLRGDK